jgi:hypothetical protein
VDWLMRKKHRCRDHGVVTTDRSIMSSTEVPVTEDEGATGWAGDVEHPTMVERAAWGKAERLSRLNMTNEAAALISLRLDAGHAAVSVLTWDSETQTSQPTTGMTPTSTSTISAAVAPASTAASA